MKLSDFDYELPQELIAQQPPSVRGDSRLLTLHRYSGEISHRHFKDFPQLLQQGDVLVMNDSKVIPARMYGKKKETGANIEIVLLKELPDNRWECLVKPGRKLQSGNRIDFGDGKLSAKVISSTEYGGRILEFLEEKERFHQILHELGEMPLPPYITRTLDEPNRYQTIYAKNEGSAAAPTAGLHFTKEIMDQIEAQGVQICYLTLHVGLGTFRPVKSEIIEEHTMHEEYFEIPEMTAKAVGAAMKEGRRVIAVGTTCVRTLESAAEKVSTGISTNGWTSIFIYPGYRFQVVDAMVTNFHLPKSTLIMMISAFAGRENVMNAYKEAVIRKYRFFSFGDAMFIHD